jgi:acetylornithine deacetylase/succinyl-diaminopimelate desuccinylase-like protein
MDRRRLTQFIDRTWEEQIVPNLVEYIRIPNKSPGYDKDWEKNGHMARAVELIAGWCKAQASLIQGLTVEVVKEEGRTPLIYMEIPGTGGASKDTVLLYGHLDKQPEMTGWRADLGPWIPKREGDKLYGRGGADDGYAAFASLTAIAALREQNIPHARCVVLIEATEESGSPDLPYYVDRLMPRIGTPTLVVCLDSGCGDYEHLWCTTSLRGLVIGDLEVSLISEGVHSGSASGVVPSSFRVIRQLLSRIEDERTGEILVPELVAEIPAQRRKQAEGVARVLGDTIWREFPFRQGVRPVTDDLVEQLLNRTWRATLSVTGQEGMPKLADAGNVSRPLTAVRCSIRIPPTTEPKKAFEAVKRVLLAEPPYGAHVKFEGDYAEGWNAPELAPWLEKSLDQASKDYFGAEAVHMGEGGTIPFMGMLGEKFPEAQFMITGVLGPQSNAHGPNEFLHIPCGKKVTSCVSQVLRDHAVR